MGNYNRIFSILVASILLSSTSLMALSPIPNAYAGGPFYDILENITQPICNTNPIPHDVDDDEFSALTYWGSEGVFLVVAEGSSLYELTPSGSSTYVGSLDDSSKGLAFIGTTLYSISTSGDELYTIDPSDGSTLTTVSISLSGFSIDNGNGLAKDPISGTLYAVLRGEFDSSSEDTRVIVTLDPGTGDATLKGILPNNVGAIAFSADGTLYGSTGFNNDYATKSFIEIDKTDGSHTFVCHYGGGDKSREGGQALALNTDNGMLYQIMAGAFLKLNNPKVLLPCDTTFIPLDSSISHARGLAYSEDIDEFLWDDGYDFESVTSSGDVTYIDYHGGDRHGLAFVGSTLYGLERSGSNLLEIDPSDGSTSSSTATTGFSFFRGHGLTADPDTGLLWAFVWNYDEIGSDRIYLITIDPDTNVATKIGQMGDIFGALEFKDGTLYGVTNDGGGNAEVLWTISKTTGAATPYCALGHGESGEAIALNPEDGLLYHSSGSDFFERINGVGSLETPVGLTLFSLPREAPVLLEIDPFTAQTLSIIFLNSEFPIVGGTGLADNPGNTLYAVLSSESDVGGDDERRLAIVDPITGDTTDIGLLDEEITGIAFMDGTLYGVTGRNTENGESNLVMIDKTDATVTTICELDYSGSNSIAYNPSDGYLYYGSSGSLYRILDTETCELSDPINEGFGGDFDFTFDFVTYFIQSILPKAQAGGGDYCDTRSLTWSPLQNLILCGGYQLTSADPTNGDLNDIGHLDGDNTKGLAFTFVSGSAIGGSPIPIDSASLILAGAQMTSAWLIPVLVAGAGIVLALVRRK